MSIAMSTKLASRYRSNTVKYGDESISQAMNLIIVTWNLELIMKNYMEGLIY
jgi:hypothetical protein